MAQCASHFRSTISRSFRPSASLTPGAGRLKLRRMTQSEFPSGSPQAEVKAPLDIVIRRLIRGASRAGLATTLAGEDRPYVSLVTVATDVAGCPLLLLSRLADHTRNIDGDPRISLLFDGTDGYANPQQGPRVTVVGRIAPCNEDSVRRRFLARHPGAELYAGFGDFSFYRVQAERAHFVGGFGRAVWLDRRLTLADSLAQEFSAAEDGVLAHMNDQHGETVTLLANRLLKRRGKGWRMVAVDPDGCDLARGDTVSRLPFDASVGDVAALRAALIALSVRAKAHD